jgi:hypothetical protein
MWLCSTDAIVPASSILVGGAARPLVKKIVNGTDLNASLYETILPTIDYTQYQNKARLL